MPKLVQTAAVSSNNPFRPGCPLSLVSFRFEAHPSAPRCLEKTGGHPLTLPSPCSTHSLLAPRGTSRYRNTSNILLDV